LHIAGVLFIEQTEDISAPPVSPRVHHRECQVVVAVMNILRTVAHVVDAEVARRVHVAVDTAGWEAP